MFYMLGIFIILYNKNNMSIGNRNNQYCRNNKEE